MKNEQHKTMIQTHPQLMILFLSKNPLYVFLALVPLYIFLLSQIINPQTPILKLIISFLGGLLYWSFFEYAVHRWPYHYQYKNLKGRWFIETFHLFHHREIEDPRVLNAGILLIYPLLTALLLPVWLITQNFEVVAAVGFGLLGYYFFYENVHYFIHRPPVNGWKTTFPLNLFGQYMKFITRYHLHHHHHNWNKNFGNTSVLWDKLFGTYDPGYKIRS
jgi:sterol desaturase/sphingolipid hydroxylase (fatty acid hydroxylase superfamily)